MPRRIRFDRVLLRLRDFYAARRRMPSYSELQRLLRYRSKGGVSMLVERLLERGIVARDAAGRLLPTPHLKGGVRLVGAVTAGFPSPAQEELLETLSLDEFLVRKPAATYLVRVQGDSMRDAGILPGDLVLAERGRTPKPGDIVIAQVDGAWTMKYYQRRGARIVLQAANARFAPIERYQHLTIEAVVIANVRRYA